MKSGTRITAAVLIVGAVIFGGLCCEKRDAPQSASALAGDWPWVSSAPPVQLDPSSFGKLRSGSQACPEEKPYDVQGFGCLTTTVPTAEQMTEGLRSRLANADHVFVAEVKNIVGLEDRCGKSASGTYEVQMSVLSSLKGGEAPNAVYASFRQTGGWSLFLQPFFPAYGLYVGAVGLIATNVILKGPEQYLHTFLWVKPDGQVVLYPEFGESSNKPNLDAVVSEHERSIDSRNELVGCELPTGQQYPTRYEDWEQMCGSATFWEGIWCNKQPQRIEKNGNDGG